MNLDVFNDPINNIDPFGLHGYHPTDEEIAEAEARLATHQAVLDEKEREISEDGFKRESLREEYYDAIRLRNEAAAEVRRLRNLQERVHNEHKREGLLDGDNLSDLDQSSCETAAAGVYTVVTRGAGAAGACSAAGAAACTITDKLDDGPRTPEDLPPEETPDIYEKDKLTIIFGEICIPV